MKNLPRSAPGCPECTGSKTVNFLGLLMYKTVVFSRFIRRLKFFDFLIFSNCASYLLRGEGGSDSTVPQFPP